MKPSSINYYVLNWSTLLGSEQTFHLRFFFIKWAFNSNNVFKYEKYSVLKSHAIHYHITCPFCIGTLIFLLHSVLAHWSSCFILYWPFDLLAPLCIGPLVFLLPKTLIIWLFNLLTLILTDVGYSRYTSCSLNLDNYKFIGLLTSMLTIFHFHAEYRGHCYAIICDPVFPP
jgi:hypothetical protein